MALTPLKLFHLVVPNPEGTVYTSPGGVLLRKLLVVNVSGGGSLVSVSAAGKRVLSGKNVPSGDVYPLVVGLPLDAADVVTAVSSVPGALTLLGTGWSY